MAYRSLAVRGPRIYARRGLAQRDAGISSERAGNDRRQRRERAKRIAEISLLLAARYK